MKRENDMFLGRRNAKHYQPSFEEHLIEIVRTNMREVDGEYHWINDGQSKLQLEVETFPIADQVVIINNMFDRFKTTRKFRSLITNELLKILYRSVRALKNRIDTREVIDNFSEVTMSIFRFDHYFPDECLKFYEQLYKNAEFAEIRGVTMYLIRLLLGYISYFHSLKIVLKNQIYTYLKFECLRYNNIENRWYLSNLNGIHEIIILLSRKVGAKIKSLEDENGTSVSDRMIEETDYMLKRAHEIDDYTSSCLNAFIDMIRIMMFSDKTIDVFLTTPGLIEDSIMTFENLVMFIRGVIISLRDGDLYERLNGATHIIVRPRKASQRRQRRNVGTWGLLLPIIRHLSRHAGVITKIE